MIDAIQIVNVTGSKDNKRLELNEAALEKILMQKSVRDKPVAVISINGKYREGKSFLLNLLLRQLQKKDITRNMFTDLAAAVAKVSKNYVV